MTLFQFATHRKDLSPVCVCVLIKVERNAYSAKYARPRTRKSNVT